MFGPGKHSAAFGGTIGIKYSNIGLTKGAIADRAEAAYRAGLVRAKASLADAECRS